MATVPQWALGRNVSAFVITPQTVATTGVLTNTTPTMTLAGYWKNFDIALSKKTEEISASDVVQENEVSVSRGTTFNADLLLSNYTASAADVVGAAFGSVDYFKYVLKSGDGGYTYTGYGNLTDFNLKTNDKGAIGISVSFKPCGVDTAIA